MSHSFEKALEKIESYFDLYQHLEVVTHLNGGHQSVPRVNDDSIVKEIVSAHHEILSKAFGVSKAVLARFLLDDIEIHERRGLLIFQYIKDDDAFGHNYESEETETGSYRNVVFSLAVLILYASSADGRGVTKDSAHVPPFLRVLKTVVADEIDGDRMDYTIRDGHSCESEIGRFDLDRVIGNAV